MNVNAAWGFTYIYVTELALSVKLGIKGLIFLFDSRHLETVAINRFVYPNAELKYMYMITCLFAYIK